MWYLLLVLLVLLLRSRGRLEMKNFIMPPVGHSISLTRLVTDPTSRDNPDKQQGVIGDNLREVSTSSTMAPLWNRVKAAM